MADAAFQKIEIIGTSETSYEEAIRNAIAKASETTKAPRWFEVAEMRGMIVEGKLKQYQVAVRIGDMKVVRQGLKTKKPGPWEVYDLGRDQAEEHDVVAAHADVVRQAIEILRREVSDNARFPLVIPEVNDG